MLIPKIISCFLQPKLILIQFAVQITGFHTIKLELFACSFRESVGFVLFPLTDQKQTPNTWYIYSITQ